MSVEGIAGTIVRGPAPGPLMIRLFGKSRDISRFTAASHAASIVELQQELQQASLHHLGETIDKI